MNNHAYLIMAHNEPEILYRLLTLLDDEKNHFYIHIDKKSKCFEKPEEIISKVKKSKVDFLRRIVVSWGGDSLIKCELMLLEAAFNAGENYSFYHFLSGVDMPIKSKDIIYNFFENRKNYVFLDFDSKTMDEKYKDRVKYYYLLQNRVGRESNLFASLQNKMLDLQGKLSINRSVDKVYQKGSNWCSLNGASAEYIMNNKRKLLREFKYTLACDELFIHTAILNSKYIKDVYMYEERAGYASRLIDWKRGMPYVFREEDYDELMDSEAMFARKFSWEIDKNIVIRIYKKLMEEYEMGKEILNKLEKFGGGYKVAFLSTVIFAILVHGYKLTNTLINHDGVYNYYTDQNILASGRWFLSIACGISSYFDLPWINGILSIFYIGLATVIIISIFQVKNYVVIILISALMAAFPSVTETLFFGFTADGYMLAMLMSVIAVRITLLNENRWKNKIIACGLICLCCAIYQAYVSFAMVLALTYFIYELLEGKYGIEIYFQWIKTQLLIYVVGLGVYFSSWKIIMTLQNVQANAYQGISEVGNMSVSLIFSGIINTIRTMLLFVFEWNVLEHGFTMYGVLNTLFIVFCIIVLYTSIRRSELYKKRIPFILFLLCIIAIPIAACIWHFTSSSVVYRPMMLYSLCMVYILTVILCDKYMDGMKRDLVAVLIVIITFNFMLQANISYFYMNKSYEKSHAMAAEMMARIHLLENDNIKQIAIVGNIGHEVALGQTEEEHKIHMLGQLLEKHVLVDQEHTVLYLQNTYDLNLEPVTRSALKMISNQPEVKNMQCWPKTDSIKIINDIIVIKLSETSANLLD